MSTIPPLLRTSLLDKGERIGIVNYADTVVYTRDKTLVAIRFGGYPEAVQAMSDSIFGGCSLELTHPDGRQRITVSSKGKRGYVRKISHDGVYAENVSYLKDDDLQSLTLGDGEDTEQVSANRNIYLFCGNDDELYCELDQKLSVPLIPEFKDYFLSELKTRGILEPLNVYSFGRSFDGWHLFVSADEKEVVSVLEDGLKNGKISIPGAKIGTGAVFSDIRGFTDYLKKFGVQIADRIKRSFAPVFDPSKDSLCDALKTVNEYIEAHTGYSLYDAQLGAAEALKRELDKDRMVMLVAECGSGKTKIAGAALYAHQQDGNKKGRKSFNVVICPSHIAKKWVRELYESIPDCYAQTVNSLSDVDAVYNIFHTEKKTVYCVISKETARNGYMRKPSVIWNRKQKGFICPHCGAVQEMTVFEDGTGYTVNADSLFFQNENSKNHKCQQCGEVLWTTLNPDILAPERTEWVRVGGYGFVHRRFANKNLLLCKSEKDAEAIREICENPDGIFPAKGAVRRYPLSAYIKRRFRHIDALLCDELHQYSGESAQGEAMAELAGISKKVIGMTATLVNGYAKGMFYLLFRLKPGLMLMDEQEYGNSREFCNQYGVVENVYQIDADQYNAGSKSKRHKMRERFLPGISPLVYSRFLMENAVFLSLSDMGKELPDYEEIPLCCKMTDEVKQEYERMERELKRIMQGDKKLGNKILSAYLNLLSAYPDQSYGHDAVMNPITKETLLEPQSVGDENTVTPKDERVLELVEQKVSGNERVIIYTAWTRLDTQDKLKRLLLDKGYRTAILPATVAPVKREEWVNKKVHDGLDVLITNSSLVETGLDLNDFTTLVFYNIAYNLYTFRQASRRSWRINQTAPRVEVYMFYYEHTMQQRALRLMASKLAAATVIEGNISEEGLSAMSDCEDMTTQLAKELMLGIKDDVDDLASNFKKMAIRNEHSEKPKVIPMPKKVQEVVSVFDADFDQMTLFDLLAS